MLANYVGIFCRHHFSSSFSSHLTPYTSHHTPHTTDITPHTPRLTPHDSSQPGKLQPTRSQPGRFPTSQEAARKSPPASQEEIPASEDAIPASRGELRGWDPGCTECILVFSASHTWHLQKSLNYISVHLATFRYLN